MVKQDLVIGIVAILIVIALSTLLIITSKQSNSIKEENDLRMKQIDLTNHQIVTACSWDIPRGIAVVLCDKQMKEAWDNFCLDYRENLSSCSMIETYFQNRDL